MKRFPSEYPKILAEAIIKAFPIEKENVLMKRIKKKNILTVAIAFALSRMPNETRVAMFKTCDVEWSAVIPLLKGNLQRLCFTSIPFEKFVFFADDDKSPQKVKEPLEVINFALKEGFLLRAFLFAAKIGLDFCQILGDDQQSRKYGDMKLEESISLVERQKSDCEPAEKSAQILRFFGSTLQAGGFCCLSLATFLVLDDAVKIQSIFIIDEKMVGEVERFVSANKEAPYREALESALKEAAGEA